MKNRFSREHLPALCAVLLAVAPAAAAQPSAVPPLKGTAAAGRAEPLAPAGRCPSPDIRDTWRCLQTALERGNYEGVLSVTQAGEAAGLRERPPLPAADMRYLAGIVLKSQLGEYNYPPGEFRAVKLRVGLEHIPPRDTRAPYEDGFCHLELFPGPDSNWVFTGLKEGFGYLELRNELKTLVAGLADALRKKDAERLLALCAESYAGKARRLLEDLGGVPEVASLAPDKVKLTKWTGKNAHSEATANLLVFAGNAPLPVKFVKERGNWRAADMTLLLSFPSEEKKILALAGRMADALETGDLDAAIGSLEGDLSGGGRGAALRREWQGKKGLLAAAAPFMRAGKVAEYGCDGNCDNVALLYVDVPMMTHKLVVKREGRDWRFIGFPRPEDFGEEQKAVRRLVNGMSAAMKEKNLLKIQALMTVENFPELAALYGKDREAFVELGEAFQTARITALGPEMRSGASRIKIPGRGIRRMARLSITLRGREAEVPIIKVGDKWLLEKLE